MDDAFAFDLLRQRKNATAPIRARPPTTPPTIPPMAPPERPLPEVSGIVLEVGDDDAVVDPEGTEVPDELAVAAAEAKTEATSNV